MQATPQPRCATDELSQTHPTKLLILGEVKKFSWSRTTCITVTSCRVWKCRCGLRWHRGWWNDAVKGNSALQNASCLFFDLEKFHDFVCLHRLIGLALERNFPKRLLYIAMQACLSERTLRVREMVGQSMQPTNGILAGCPLGNRLARVVHNDIVDCVKNA